MSVVLFNSKCYQNRDYTKQPLSEAFKTAAEIYTAPSFVKALKKTATSQIDIFLAHSSTMLYMSLFPLSLSYAMRPALIASIIDL